MYCRNTAYNLFSILSCSSILSFNHRGGGEMKLRRKDLVKRWNVSLRTVDRWLKTKNIPRHTTMTGSVWFDEKEIEEWEKKMGLTGKAD